MYIAVILSVCGLGVSGCLVCFVVTNSVSGLVVVVCCCGFRVVFCAGVFLVG